ncbi:hypothetical protein CHLNCDRAFT_134947 [Chlorella variabilis]|uniref:Uncharacterized protein n=1 Tax=Chlorella variabilis TaxID=554065 RepID=E1ZH68_CHLVA|nr:hypothetical protein CHLNCDRAFT_134947 [Chlorella variabilis]EFN55069.1 hypothetical protein CHLNCDRAFT_134947 [Chlorella variabilis]|eukprot:XP_005847171.1 hypothetical protein CHLNCDRAFT_134947 [Chlorella variabilis]
MEASLSGGTCCLQLALYLAGNAITVAIGLLIWNLNSVLADFRDSMLYALLCSIALRPVKDWLVAHMDASLGDPRRSVGGALAALAALPLTAAVDAWEEARAILAKWRQAVQEEFQRRQAMLLKRGGGEGGGAAGAGGATTPTSPRTPRTAAAAAAAAASGTAATAPTAARTTAAAAMHTMPSLAVYGHAAVKVLKSRRTSKKRRKQRQLLRQRPPEGSSVLFRWLFRTCAAWLVWEWVRDSWSATVQLVLLVLTAVLAVGVVPLLLLTTNRYLGAAVFSPAKTPAASTTQASGSAAELQGRRGSLQSVSPPKRPRFSPFAEARQRRRGPGVPPTPESPGEEAAGAALTAADRWWGWWRGCWRGARAACAGVLGVLDAALRSALRANLHALVSLLLILGLFVGTTGLAAFLSVRVAQEGRATVLAVRDVFPTAWAGMAASTPLLADAAAAAGEGRRGGGGGALPGAAAAAGGAAALGDGAGLPSWVAAYQAEALALVQQSLPAVASWAETQFYGALEKQNLTSALGDMRLLYETMQGPRQCSEREREKLLVALARAEVALQAARDSQRRAEQQLGEARTRLRAAVQGLDAARGREQPAPRPVPKCVPRAPAPAAGEEAGPGGSGGGCAPEEAVALDGRVLVLEEGVVAADAALEGAKAAHKAAALQLDGAEREQRAALSRLQLCGEERRGGHSSSLLPGLAGEVGAGLQAAYAKLWRRQLREGLADMRAVARLCASALRGIAQRSGDAVADLSGLQRLAQAAADPLIAAGRVAGRLFAGSVGSTTAAALMGGLGVLRLGVGVVKAGMQLMLFLALLYYLLAARADPLLAAAGMLPLSEAGRQRTAMALNRALGGVLVSSMKLIAFHGCFSWITFRVMNLPLTYTASVASAACALLPFVPTYAVALPGCAVLLAQGRLLAAVLFFALHFMGYYIGDTVILEDIPGGHPYMLSLGILGGIYAFENPLQGCLLGPILLSLLSVFYNLHSEFMGSGSGQATPDGGGPLHRLWSLTPGTINRQQGQGQGQGQGQMPGRLGQGGSGEEQGGAGMSPDLAAGLHVSVRPRRVQLPAEGGAAYSPARRTSGEEGGRSPGASPPQQQAAEAQRPSSRQSLSLSLGGGRGRVVRDSPGGSAAASAAASVASDGEGSGESDSGANSFSFNPSLHPEFAKMHHD